MARDTLENRVRVRLQEILALKRRLIELIEQLEDNFYGVAAVDPAGALNGDGSAGDPLAVRVDGVTVQINGSNQLEAIGSGTPSDTVEDLDGTGDAGASTEYSRGDHKHADTNRPTNDEKAALAGTDGTPSAANPFVTDSDPRLASTGITQLTGDVTAGPGSGSQAATIANNAVTDGKFRQGAALSVVGVTGNSTANVADIAAGSDHQVLRRSGTALAFGAVNLAQSNAVTGTLPSANLPTAIKTRAITFVIDGGGSTITTGIKGDLSIPFACTITGVRLLADQGGAIVIDIWKDTYANYAPTDADSITSSTPPTITATNTKSEDTTLTSWTTSIGAGDTLRFNVDSVTTIQRVTITLTVTL